MLGRVPPSESGASPRSLSALSGGVMGDTIVALSTASGAGAIGIVRLSGVHAVRVAQQVFRPARPPDLANGHTHVMRYGHVVDPSNGHTVDEALAVVMRAPATYTREDVVEIHCHGGPAAQRAVLRVMVALGARPAEPGEFTKRAFLHGRIDLTQAESVAGIVQARSASALRASVRQLDGGLADRVRGLRTDLVTILAGMEVAIDFSEEDVDEVDMEAAESGLADIESRLGELLSTALLGRALEEGVRTAIVGRPNVGKSSLLNALVMRERAIVSEFPGTTRDTVEEFVEIAGIPLCLVDTAGLRPSDDHLERLGIERSKQALEQADLVLIVLDLTEGVTPEDKELLGAVSPARTIVVGNKLDLVMAQDEAAAGCGTTGSRIVAEHLAGAWTVCEVSARTGFGIDELRRAIETIVVGDNGLQLDEPLLATERQRSLVEQSMRAAKAARTGIGQTVPVELVCDDLRRSIDALGSITGEELVPDLVEEIFRRFCIGK